MGTRPPLAVLIAGGGVAALEAALALRDLAGDLVSLRILAPNGDFGYRPLSVREPFAHARAARYSLSELAASAGAELIEGEFAYLEADRRVAITASGDELPYDALLLGLGAKTKDAFPHVTTIDAEHMDELLRGLVQDVEDGYARSVAFASPARQGWPLPLYELALMTAARAHDMGVAVELTVVTPESSPLAFFGERASQAVATLLDEAGVGVIAGVDAHVPEPGELLLMPGGRTLNASRIVALPELFGPAVRGLPTGEHGFIPVDGHGRVRGVEDVWAAGDATDGPVKFGGLAAQQADVAAASIAAAAGADVATPSDQPEIHAILLTGREPRYLSARLVGGKGFDGELTKEPTWQPVAKVNARYLTAYLDEATPLAAGPG